MEKITKIEITHYQGWLLDGAYLGEISEESYCDQWCDHLRRHLERAYPGAEIEVDWLAWTAPTDVTVYSGDEDVSDERVGGDDMRGVLQRDAEDAWETFDPIA